jgi:hypothetical protein
MESGTNGTTCLQCQTTKTRIFLLRRHATAHEQHTCDGFGQRAFLSFLERFGAFCATVVLFFHLDFVSLIPIFKELSQRRITALLTTHTHTTHTDVALFEKRNNQLLHLTLPHTDVALFFFLFFLLF